MIAFASIGEAGSDIWTVQANGTYPVRLTFKGARNDSPAWSPDGRRIAFVSNRDGTNDIWMMNSDGSQQIKLIASNDQESSPAFSPSGEQLVFSRSDIDTASLWVVNVNGTGLRQVTKTAAGYDFGPAWGPRGIVFASSRPPSGDDFKLWSVRPDGTDLRRIGDVNGLHPRWLPDGRIVFTDDNPRSKALSVIGVLNPTTGEKRTLVDVQGRFTPVDIRPGKEPNLVNPRSTGRMQVAILSTRTFDSKSVNKSTITFGRTGSENSLASCGRQLRDVNGDGLPDLVCRFALRYAGFQVGDTSGVLRFDDENGVPYEGRDAIAIVGTDDPDDHKD